VDRSELMSRIRSVSMKELAAKSRAESLVGCRLFSQPKNVPGRPDYANKTRKVAVFFHGCFWHGHFHSKVPKTNVEFWKNKIEANRKRDRRAKRKLLAAGWTVLVLWECGRHSTSPKKEKASPEGEA